MSRKAGQPDRLPVHVLTGFLGAGKTTLLNRLLADPSRGRWAVIVNEFGEVGIDARLVVRSDEQVIELENGCLCCQLRGDLVSSLFELLERRNRRLLRQPFERVAIETSGLASPGPIVQTLVVEGRLVEAFENRGVLTVCHAARIEDQLLRHPEAVQQVGSADHLILNHIDRVDALELPGLRARLAQLNPLAAMHVAERGNLELDKLLARAQGVRITPEFDARPAVPWEAGQTPVAHTAGATSVVLESDLPIDLHRLKLWLRLLSNQRDHELWRIKGILRLEQTAEPLLVQGVYQWLEISALEGPPPTRSQLVLIGRGLDRAALERGFRALAAQ